MTRTAGTGVSGVTELHLHLEGSLTAESAVELAAQKKHIWGRLRPGQLRRTFRYRSLDEFFGAIREMAALLASPDALERVSFELSLFLAGYGVPYAEVYFSPYIYIRWGLGYQEVLEAVDRGFHRGADEGGAHCMILLDSVRHFGPAAAEVVVAGYETHRWPRVVGFGLGGAETVDLTEFAPVYRRARELGLGTVVHAGEASGPADVRTAVEILNVDRIAHGILAVEDSALLGLLRERKVPLDLAISSNYRTSLVRGPHPIRTLLDHGVVVTLNTDDPALFRTNPPAGYRLAERVCGVGREELVTIARNGIDFSFAPASVKTELHALLDGRLANASRRVDFR